ncbi:PD40 domain-containing protein [Flavobacterium sp. J27]|uniref:PD40 domain-containing protein n=1 Tax=Flavobacterium sp. J27 TaxID=2060419 RepID=UPI00102FBAB3|nr:PD40 domain-containing protein [Flavobacterium sp. J27]
MQISFKDDIGNWSKAKNMGAIINTEGHELCPFVTKDGKYLFYTNNQDIYWVDATIISQIKK